MLWWDLHELVEVLKCKHDGVTQEQVDVFDMEFEEKESIKKPLSAMMRRY